VTNTELCSMINRLQWDTQRLSEELDVAVGVVELYTQDVVKVPKFIALAVRYLYDQHSGTKPCPYCGGALSSLASQNTRLCTQCLAEISWELSAGQKPLVGSNRQDRRTT